MTPETLELEVPDAPGDAALLALLSELLTVRPGRVRTADRVLLDTFDGRLRAAGLRAEWPARRTAARALVVHEHGAPPRAADVPDGPAVAAGALPDGALRDRLAPVLEERALLPVARVRSRTLPIAVLDEDEKTVVRLALERPEVVARRHVVPLAPRLVVDAVRGYDRDFDRTVRRLRDGLGLAPADEPLFDAAVLAAGGRPEGVSTKVRVGLKPGTRADVAAGLVLDRLADVAEANVPGTLDDLDPEFLHDLRVSIRRARSVLREMRGVHDPEQRAHVRTELRWAQEVTGPVRDLDVQLLEWDALTASLGDGRGGELEPLRALLARRRQEERTRMRRALRSKRFTATIEAWRAIAAAPPAGEHDPDRPRAALRIEAVAAERIWAVYRHMVRDGRTIDDDSPDEALHELRKRGKELRYLLELFGSLFPGKVVKPMVASLKELQDVLGRFQDLSVQTALLRTTAGDLANEPGGPDALLAAGLVISAHEAQARDARDEFAAHFDAFASSRQRAHVRATFKPAVKT